MKFIPNVTRVAALVVITAGVLFTGCQKESSSVSQTDNEQFAQASSESDAEAQTTFDDVFDNVVGVNTEVGVGGTGVFASANHQPGEEIISGAQGADSSINACFTVTVTRLNLPNLFPVRIVIDFGSGCIGKDGRVRRGKIITEYTGRLLVPGKKATTVFDGYYINDVQVQGTHIIENVSTTQAWAFRVTVIQGKLTRANGNYIEWNSDKTITQIDGLGTPLYPLDDVFSIKSEVNGSVKRDSVFCQWSAKTLPDNPLIKKFTCRWIVKGKVAIQRNNSSVGILDYGNGDCDNLATITVNGVVHEISLH